MCSAVVVSGIVGQPRPFHNIGSGGGWAPAFFRLCPACACTKSVVEEAPLWLDRPAARPGPCVGNTPSCLRLLLSPRMLRHPGVFVGLVPVVTVGHARARPIAYNFAPDTLPIIDVRLVRPSTSIYL